VIRHKRISFILVFGTWLLGLAVIWWLTPVGPRDGWQPPANQDVLGILTDDRTLVTIQNYIGYPRPGPVSLWDIETGQMRSCYLGPQDKFFSITLRNRHDWLVIEQLSGNVGEYIHHVRILDAWTGGQKLAFDCLTPDDGLYCAFTPDERTVATLNYEVVRPGEEWRSRLEWRDTASGKVFRTLIGVRPGLCFSPDGQRFAAPTLFADAQGLSHSAIDILDVPSGRELSKLASSADDSNWPREFSPDGKLLLDCWNRVWDVESAKVRFYLPSSCQHNPMFTPDGRYVVALTKLEEGTFLAYCDVSSGQEMVERRVLLDPTERHYLLSRASSDGRFLRCDATELAAAPKWKKLAAKINGLEYLAEETFRSISIEIETATGREVVRGDWAGRINSDRRLRYVARVGWEIWDLPPRKPLRWLLPSVAIWSIAFALLAAWRIQRARRVRAEAEATDSVCTNRSADRLEEQSSKW
jgi:hypothetical protein